MATCPTRSWATREHLRQVLLNLLGNALKYTREGGVTLNVRRAEALAPRVKVEFRITDTGIGISPEQQANLFQPLHKATAGLAAGSGSSGLGLAISRMLVERMGGRIGVESDEGWGSTFWFTLPLEPAPASAVIVAPAPAVGLEQLAGRTVLLVEDNRINQQVAIGMLKRLGVTARTADNGEAALVALAESAFDVVFMDVQMPGMDGLEATRHLRSGQAGELNRNVPVIAMTGHVSREDRDACTGAGMNDYVAKPISGDRLREAIARVLAASPAVAPDAAAASDVAFDLWALAEQLDGDRDLAAEIFTLFLDDSRERLLLMAAAVRNYDCDTVVAEAKPSKGRPRTCMPRRWPARLRPSARRRAIANANTRRR